MVEVVCCGGAVCENDDGFGLVGRGLQEDVEVVLAVGDGDLEVHLSEPGGDRHDLGVDFADEDGGFARSAGLVLCEADLGRDCCSEEEGLAVLRGRKDVEAFGDIGQHAAWSGGEEAVCLVKDDELDATEPADGVFARGADVVCQTAWRGDDDVRALGEGDGLSAHVGAARDEDGFEGLWRRDCFELLVHLESEFAGGSVLVMGSDDGAHVLGLLTQDGSQGDGETYRVGVKTTAKMAEGSSAHFCKIGTAKATVFPEPVRLPPMQSLPLRISGIQPF